MKISADMAVSPNLVSAQRQTKHWAILPAAGPMKAPALVATADAAQIFMEQDATALPAQTSLRCLVSSTTASAVAAPGKS